MTTIYTVGHGLADPGLIHSILAAAGVDVLVDVRSTPYSRRNPQFSRAPLASLASSWGMAYDWRGANLGGFGPNEHFDETVHELAGAAPRRTIALLCSEKDYTACHRKTLLTPAFQRLGLTVVHLLHDGTTATEPGLCHEPDTLF